MLFQVQEYGATPPWHDIQAAIHGPAVYDVETVFRERWEDPTPLSRNPVYVTQDRILGMDLTEYVTPCLFLGDPNQRPAGPAATLPRKLLQPLALLDQLRFEMRHDPGDGRPYGVLVIEKK